MPYSCKLRGRGVGDTLLAVHSKLYLYALDPDLELEQAHRGSDYRLGLGGHDRIMLVSLRCCEGLMLAYGQRSRRDASWRLPDRARSKLSSRPCKALARAARPPGSGGVMEEGSQNFGSNDPGGRDTAADARHQTHRRRARSQGCRGDTCYAPYGR